MIALTFDDGGLAVNLANAPQVTRLQIQQWMTQVVQHVHTAVVRNMGASGLIGQRTGTLARAITDRVTVTGDGAIGEVFPDPAKAPYGAIQEFGGTIVPKTAQALAIPLEAMLTGNGVARGTARQVKDDPGAFGFLGTFIRNNVIFGRTGTGRSASIVPLFALKSSVTLPARSYLDVTLREELTWIQDALEKLTSDIVSLTFGGDVA